MAINSTFLGATTISGDEAKAFNRMVSRGRPNRSVLEAAESGRRMATTFAKKGVITFKIKPTKKHPA